MTMADIASVPRVIPGAPQPVAVSRSQRKKRKTGTKSKTPGSPVEGSVTIPDAPSPVPADGTPNETDAKEDNVPHDLIAASEATHEDLTIKSSPIIELVQKRMRSLNKKISRISSYTAIDYEKLNDDQKRILKTLPSLEAVYKELDEVKKSIEAYEAELSRDQISKRAESERAVSSKIQDAVSSAQERYCDMSQHCVLHSYRLLQASHISRTSSILTLLRLRSVLASGDVPPVALDFDEGEGSAISTVCDALLGEENDSKYAILSGFLSGEGDFHGVSYTRLSSIVQSFLNSPREPTPVPVESEHAEVEPASVDEPVSGIPGPLSVSSSFHFVQASELEMTSFENNVEEKSDIEPNGAHEEPAQATEDVSVEPVETSTQPLDWAAEADEEGGLPPIANLASFSPSGSATPAVQTFEVNLPSSVPHVNGDISGPIPLPEDDGFTTASRGGRGRGRGHRGERGGMRGGFRGDRTGFHRGERGSFRGNRGGDRGHRGNRSDGDWRNGDGERRNGDGEHRGRGRSRGRGRGEGGERRGSGQQEFRGGAPPL